MPRPSPALLVALAALVASLSGVAVATIPARDGDVHTCYNRSTGEIKLVDTQSDRFRCPRGWRGFTYDTDPTRIESPNGAFRANVTNSTAVVQGPTGKVEVTASTVRVQGARVEIQASAILDLNGTQVRINGTPQSGD